MLIYLNLIPTSMACVLRKLSESVVEIDSPLCAAEYEEICKTSITKLDPVIWIDPDVNLNHRSHLENLCSIGNRTSSFRKTIDRSRSD